MTQLIQSAESALKGKQIILVLFSFELGGAERQALHLARYLKNTCHAHVQFWAFCNPGRLIPMIEDLQIPWRLIPLGLDFRSVHVVLDTIKLARILYQEHPDVLLPYMTPANVYCGLAWRFTGARVCIWNQRSAGIERVNPGLEKIAAKNVSAFISNSQQGADFLLDTYNVDPKKVYVIRNGVQPETAFKGDEDVKKDEFTACMVANLHPGKDHETLLQAWALAIKQIKQPARLLLAGRFDSNYQKLRELVSQLEIESYVTFLGQVDDIASLLRSSDLGILLSPFLNWEGTSNAILEYMLAGLPVIATDTPAIRDIVGPDNIDFLVPVGSISELANLITKVAGDSSLRKNFGLRNMDRANEEFSLEKMCESSIQVILDTLNKDSGLH
jgi:glycosyltransferase involved in cell wall biosynthesis